MTTGIIIEFPVSSPPTGYFECDGSAVSRTTYASLFSVIGTTYGVGDGSTTFNLPDLRGRFLRGFDDGAGVDSGRVFGSNQDDALQNVTGSISKIPSTTIDKVANGVLGVSGNATINNGTTGTRTTEAGYQLDASNVAQTDTETRPVNNAFMYCIKY